MRRKENRKEPKGVSFMVVVVEDQASLAAHWLPLSLHPPQLTFSPPSCPSCLPCVRTWKTSSLLCPSSLTYCCVLAFRGCGDRWRGIGTCYVSGHVWFGVGNGNGDDAGSGNVICHAHHVVIYFVCNYKVIKLLITATHNYY